MHFGSRQTGEYFAITIQRADAGAFRREQERRSEADTLSCAGYYRAFVAEPTHRPLPARCPICDRYVQARASRPSTQMCE